MNKLLHVLKPTNRRVRLLVGLLLAGMLVLQVSQSVATHETATVTIVNVQGDSVATSDLSLLQRVEALAETDHLALLRLCKQTHQQRELLGGYTCTFIKQERIRGDLGDEQHIDVKFRPRPFSVAMHWTQNAPTGDAILYVQGQYQNDEGQSQMLVRPASTFLQKLTGGSVLRLPDGKDAMKNTLRPCTQFGFTNGIDSLIEVYELARQRGESEERFGTVDPDTGQTIRHAQVGGRDCVILERILPYREDVDYPAARTLVFIDIDRLLPLRVIGYDWQGRLSCNYEYHDVNFDVALSEQDFTPQANNIHRR